MKKAILNLKKKPTRVLIDGNQKPTIRQRILETVIKGDQLHKEIAAASIIAKVTRDTLMINYNNTYPHYNFNEHKGYGTKKHYAALKKHGPCDIHRKTFRLL